VRLLLSSFGGTLPYVAGAILVAVMALLVLAFRQGRTIEFWPPKIGSKPGGADEAAMNPRDRTGQDQKQPAVRMAAPVASADRVYEVADAARFYQEIAPNYDQGNSARLLATHMEVITRIDQARKAKPDLRVLDLGGGTGRNVATNFFNDHHISWTYVDYCPAMLEQLQQHLAGRRLYERLNVHLDDINRIHLRLPARSYDVILLNLVLSSMPRLPDFTRLSALLAPGGLLIVADINPAYTHAHPHYRATGGDGSLVAMHTHPVEPLAVATRARDARLQLAEMTKVGSDEISYSFIITFVNRDFTP
jgi:ubiquinone/menaquinone biosynthesis C-methylase UbiE